MAVEVEKETTNGAKRGASRTPPLHPATTKQKVVLAIWLILVLGVILALWAREVTIVDGYLHRENRAPWVIATPVVLKPGPTAFRYDVEHKALVFIGSIDAKTKFELLALLPTETKTKSPETESSYWAAIDKLTFASNEGVSGLLISLLLLGGLSGALGAHLRSITAFVGNASFKNELDLVVWWPYYVMRPFTGLIIGMTIVAIVQGGFLAVGRDSPTGTLAWIAIAILAGFGDDEFTQKLRQLTKTLFGEGNNKPKVDTKIKIDPSGGAGGAAKVSDETKLPKEGVATKTTVETTPQT